VRSGLLTGSIWALLVIFPTRMRGKCSAAQREADRKRLGSIWCAEIGSACWARHRLSTYTAPRRRRGARRIVSTRERGWVTITKASDPPPCKTTQ
jgi:hypothetical protein